MDFLSKYDASIECRKRKVIFQPEAEPTFEFMGEPRKETKEFLSALKAQKMLDRGCTGFLAHVVDTSQAEDQKREDIRVVCNYPEVFLEELLGLAPDREVEFEIELIPSTKPFSKASYRMALAELKELQEQLRELLNKELIRPSNSPWGASILLDGLYLR
ncbi:uncharacterized protein LOC122004307 [Zingiber officinale]|uniref:uncharacterized protein LOC122004307 n=1 Tax=Zingiber officinale TaxID=94328 RepID=UPI001C4D583D|nr:uncharacterized protein LOC122004307 [Zingiber officinale]